VPDEKETAEEEPATPGGPQTRMPALRRFRVARVEKRTAMAHMSWRDFWRDLGFRFLVAGVVVAVVAITVLLLRLFVR